MDGPVHWEQAGLHELQPLLEAKDPAGQAQVFPDMTLGEVQVVQLVADPEQVRQSGSHAEQPPEASVKWSERHEQTEPTSS